MLCDLSNKMLNVQDVGRSGYGMFRMWDAGDVECFRGGVVLMCWMWDIQDVGCSG